MFCFGVIRKLFKGYFFKNKGDGGGFMKNGKDKKN